MGLTKITCNKKIQNFNWFDNWACPIYNYNLFEEKDRQTDRQTKQNVLFSTKPHVSKQCYVKISLQAFDNKNVTFEEHIRAEHNMWHYLFFIVLVKVKDPTEFTGPESYVHQMVKVMARDLIIIDITCYLYTWAIKQDILHLMH